MKTGCLSFTVQSAPPRRRVAGVGDGRNNVLHAAHVTILGCMLQTYVCVRAFDRPSAINVSRCQSLRSRDNERRAVSSELGHLDSRVLVLFGRMLLPIWSVLKVTVPFWVPSMYAGNKIRVDMYACRYVHCSMWMIHSTYNHGRTRICIQCRYI